MKEQTLVNGKQITEMSQDDFSNLWDTLKSRSKSGNWNVSNLIDNIKSRIEAGHKFIDISIEDVYSIAYNGSTLTPNSNHYKFYGKKNLKKAVKILSDSVDDTIKVFPDGKTYLLRVL